MEYYIYRGMCSCRAASYLLVVSPVCPWLSPLPHHRRTAYSSSNPLWYTERNLEDRNEGTWPCMCVLCKVHTDILCTYIDIVPSITSIEHYFFSEWQITLCLTASLSSLPIIFAPILCWPCPLQDILSIPFGVQSTEYTHHTEYIRRNPDEADSGGNKWIYGVWCELWETTTYPLPPFPCPEYSVLLVLLLHSGCEHNVGLGFGITITHLPPTHPSKTKISSIDK